MADENRLVPKLNRLRSEISGATRPFIDKHRDVISRLLIIAGLVVMIFPLATEVYGVFSQYELKLEWEEMARQQQSQSRTLEKEQLKLFGQRKFEAEESILQSAPARKAGEKKGPFPNTRIIIPKIQVDQVVLEGTDPDMLRNGPGHYPETVNPGDKGNVAIAGHRVTYTHPFNRLDELAPGDAIVLETFDVVYEYSVSALEEREPSDVYNLQPTDDRRLTLTTCTPKYSAQSRLNVVAKLKRTTERKPTVAAMIKSVFEPKREKKPVIITGDEIQLTLRKADSDLAKNPKDATSHARAADAYFRIDRYSEAIYHIKTGLELDPKNKALLALKKSIDDREIFLRNQLALGGDVSSRFSNNAELGEILLAKGDFNGAILAFEEASRIEPYSADILYYLAVGYEKTGAADKAIQALKAAVRLSPDYSEAVDALTRLVNR